MKLALLKIGLLPFALLAVMVSLLAIALLSLLDRLSWNLDWFRQRADPSKLPPTERNAK